ncbi:MAG: ATPase/histidine kinase/DNA gyrase domain protein [Aeromicrobium sp.]|nr:ATPase/histidine kinase/DNA gyrase domain protein [Aeromicrobium sp.]
MRTAPLSRRILLVTLAGGVIVAAVAFALSVPLVRSVARDQARVQLVRAIDTLAAKPVATAKLMAEKQKIVGTDDRSYAIVRRNGEVSGAAGDVLTPAQINTVLTAGKLSTSMKVNGQELLVEGRATRRGFSVIAVQPVGAVDEATTALRHRLLLALLVGLGAAGTLGLVLSRTLNRSVAEAATAARRLAAGERGIAIAPSSVREIADMSRAVSALDDALIASEGRQREFLLSISHEIRTPLTALRGYAEALADGAIGADEMKATGETLVAETARLDRFVSDLLALARLEADDFAIEAVDVQLNQLLTDLLDAWQATCEREGIALHAEGSGATVHTDPMRLRQLLDGLVENAIRATPAGGGVVVRTKTTPSGVIIEVEDAGPGLDPADIAATFERGALHAKYRELRSVGTGLGLSIAHRLATRMDVQLDVRSAPQSGAIFSIQVPIR